MLPINSYYYAFFHSIPIEMISHSRYAQTLLLATHPKFFIKILNTVEAILKRCTRIEVFSSMLPSKNETKLRDRFAIVLFASRDVSPTLGTR